MSDRRLSFTDMIMLCLGALAVGGSLVFWFVLIGKIDSGVINSYMNTLIICCAAIPAASAAVLWLIKKRESLASWLLCTGAAGLIATIITFIVKTIKDNAPDWSLFFPLLCCAVAGCALPSAISLLISRLIKYIVSKNQGRVKPKWSQQKKDILDMTHFDMQK
ncbi:MAG: hypothetical protein J6L81_02660 [Clostridia bacterium]|nr:hypothetical protein [Clostridia bacterium]